MRLKPSDTGGQAFSRCMLTVALPRDHPNDGDASYQATERPALAMAGKPRIISCVTWGLTSQAFGPFLLDEDEDSSQGADATG